MLISIQILVVVTVIALLIRATIWRRRAKKEGKSTNGDGRYIGHEYRDGRESADSDGSEGAGGDGGGGD